MAYVPGVTVPNPEGFVWQREPTYHFYTGEKAQAYVDEFVADLAFLALPPDSPFYEESKNWMLSNVEDYSAIPEDRLPFALRSKQPSLFAYTQAFYLWVAAGADKAAKDKLKEISKLNDQLKSLNDAWAMVGEVDAMVADEAEWDDGDPSVEDAMHQVSIRRNSVAESFIGSYNRILSSAGLNPEQREYDLDTGKVSGATLGAVVRNLQAEANKKGNELQREMAESASKISFQSAVNEGFKSFGDRWFQMVTQTNSTT